MLHAGQKKEMDSDWLKQIFHRGNTAKSQCFIFLEYQQLMANFLLFLVNLESRLKALLYVSVEYLKIGSFDCLSSDPLEI